MQDNLCTSRNSANAPANILVSAARVPKPAVVVEQRATSSTAAMDVYDGPRRGIGATQRPAARDAASGASASCAAPPVLPTSLSAKYMTLSNLLKEVQSYQDALNACADTHLSEELYTLRTRYAAQLAQLETQLTFNIKNFSAEMLQDKIIAQLFQFTDEAFEAQGLLCCEAYIDTLLSQVHELQADLFKKLQKLSPGIRHAVRELLTQCDFSRRIDPARKDAQVANFALHVNQLILLVLYEQEAELGSEHFFADYLQLRGECYHATAAPPSQPFRWLGAGNQRTFLHKTQRQNLLKKCGRPFCHNPIDPDVYLNRLSKNNRYHAEIYNMWVYLHNQLDHHAAFVSLRAHINILKFSPHQQSMLGSNSMLEPSPYVLPSILVRQGRQVLDQTTPTLQFCNKAERQAYKKLGELLLQAQTMDNDSRAEGATWLQVAHLLTHEKILRQLSQDCFACMDLLRQRCLERDELVKPSSAKPAAPKNSGSQKKTTAAKVQRRVNTPPSPPHEVTLATATLRQELAQLTLAAPPSVESQLSQEPSEPQDSATWQCISRAKLQQHAIKARHLGDVTLYSRLPAGELKKLLIDTIEPSVWASNLPHAPRWYQIARSLVQHAEKHTLPRSAIEDWIEAGLQHRNASSPEVGVRADRIFETVHTVSTPQAYGVYHPISGKLITYCNRSLCGATHYPTTIRGSK